MCPEKCPRLGKYASREAGRKRVAARLAAAIPEQREVSIVRGDYRLDNAVVDGAGDVRALLDWELCTLGDPLADVGLLLAYWPDPDELASGLPSSEQLVDAYAGASGRDIGAVAFFHALAYWKIAIILQGVYRRWLENPANGSADVADLAPRVERLVERAERATRAAGL